MSKSSLIRFGLSMDSKLVSKLDQHIDQHGYASRSEAVRDLIRKYLVEKEWEAQNGDVIGTITIVYDHHTHGLSDKLNDLQHQFFKNIISSTHIHLDQHNCLEVLIVRGDVKVIKAITTKISSAKGVKHSNLAMTTTGENI